MSDRNVKFIGIPVTVGTFFIVGGPVRLLGWTLKETTGAATAACDLYDGTDATGALIVPFTLLSNESVRDWLGPNGVVIPRGLFLNVLSGSVRGSVMVELLDESALYSTPAMLEAD